MALISIMFIVLLPAIVLLSCIGKKDIGGGADTSAVVSVSIGEVKVIKSTGESVDATAGMELKESESIETGKASFVSIKLGEMGILQIRENSSLVMTALLKGDSREVYLKQGRALSKIKKLGKNQQYLIKTPTLTASVRGTRFSISHDKFNTAVALNNGSVEITRIKNDEKVLLKEGEVADITDAINLRSISPIEKKEFELLEAMDPQQDKELSSLPDKKTNGDEKKSEIWKIEKELEQQGGAYMNIAQLRAKYGRIDVIIDYRGNTYTGVIVSRGTIYKILVPGRAMMIPFSKIKNTRSIN
jgi:hypothetical protein